MSAALSCKTIYHSVDKHSFVQNERPEGSMRLQAAEQSGRVTSALWNSVVLKLALG